MQRKNIKHFAAGICLLFTSLFYCLAANADVLEGTSGQTLSGEYAVIINTDTSASQETGNLLIILRHLLPTQIPLFPHKRLL